MNKVRAKKHLGQHFLTDLSIARQIVDSLEVDKAYPVLEIGPGMGVLTQFMSDFKNLSLVEIDTESVAYLKNHFPFVVDHIFEHDFLKMDIAANFPEQFAIIGNFPYNISSQIFFKVLEHKNRVTQVVCMLQREVARRLASPPGSKEYGILSVFLQAYYDIEYLMTVNEGVFDPPPKVKSAVIRVKRNNIKSYDCDEKLFFTVVKTAFNQRRKTLRNSLRALFTNSTEVLTEPIFNMRPEQLSVNDFVYLASLLAKK
jgi:16S rRNA (adenine1518-N6/adenine1519-N6)-dimethyltransferase